MFKDIKKNHYRKGFSIVDLIAIILIIWILASMVIPGLLKQNDAELKSQSNCFRNQWLLSSAIELYNMDNNSKLDTAFPGQEFDDCYKILTKNKYFKSPIIIKDNCSYGFVDITGSGSVFCKPHGAIGSKIDETPIYPQIDNKKSYYDKYNDLKNKMEIKNKKTKKGFKFNINLLNYFNFLYNGPLIPIILLIITIVYSLLSNFFSTKKK